MAEDDGGYELGECYEIAQAIALAVLATDRRRFALTESRSRFGTLLKDADESSAAATAMLKNWIARQPAMATGQSAQEVRPPQPDGGATT